MILHHAKIITMKAIQDIAIEHAKYGLGRTEPVVNPSGYSLDPPIRHDLMIDGWAATGPGPDQAFDIFGEPIEFAGMTILDPVGSFETPAQMIHLMTPTLVKMAWHRIQDEFLMTSILHDLAIRKVLTVQPYENACWILKATPEELQSWAETIARQPS